MIIKDTIKILSRRKLPEIVEELNNSLLYIKGWEKTISPCPQGWISILITCLKMANSILGMSGMDMVIKDIYVDDEGFYLGYIIRTPEGDFDNDNVKSWKSSKDIEYLLLSIASIMSYSFSTCRYTCSICGEPGDQMALLEGDGENFRFAIMCEEHAEAMGYDNLEE